jgi:hypothetical protein
MVVIAHATLPNSIRPVLFLVMLPAVAKGVINSACVAQASKISNGDAVI